jgi:hypothetical protein
MIIRWTLACAAVIGAITRTAHADEAPAPLPVPDPPAGAARVALGLLDPLRISRLDVTASGPRSNSEIDPGVADIAFAFVPRWSFVNTETDWAWAGAKVGWQVSSILGSVEGGNPVTVRVDDVELNAAYSRTPVRDARGDQLLLGPRLGLAFPSSYASRLDTIVLRTSLGLGLDLHVPLLRGDWLRGVLFSGNGTWEGEIAKNNGQNQNLTAAGPPTTLGLPGNRPVGALLLRAMGISPFATDKVGSLCAEWEERRLRLLQGCCIVARCRRNCRDPSRSPRPQRAAQLSRLDADEECWRACAGSTGSTALLASSPQRAAASRMGTFANHQG